MDRSCLGGKVLFHLVISPLFLLFAMFLTAEKRFDQLIIAELKP